MEIRELEIIAQQIGDEKLEIDICQLSGKCAHLSREVNETIRNCSVKLGMLKNSTLFVNEQLAWLHETQIAITAPHSLPLHVHEVQKLMTKLAQLETESNMKIDELQSTLSNSDEKMTQAEREQAQRQLDDIDQKLKAWTVIDILLKLEFI